jgi:Uma2 family endonuclease
MLIGIAPSAGEREDATVPTMDPCREDGCMAFAIPDPEVPTLADVLKRLGGINPRRICANPPPGRATEKDVLRFLEAANKRLYELVDGVLVEKVMGVLESSLACDLIKLLGLFLDAHPLGFLLGPDGALRLLPKLVRIPDISFISWDRLPKRVRPTTPIPDLAPDLAVEVLSPGNTRREMARKVRDYFISGARLVWLVDPRQRSVQVYTAPDRLTVLTEDQALDGGNVLPGLILPLQQVFAQIPREASTKRTTRSPGKRRPRAK